MLKRARLDGNDKAVLVTQALQGFLKELQANHGVQAFIAGGYPRDLYCNKSPKDIDLYVARNQFGKAWKALFPSKKRMDFDKWTVSELTPAYQHQNVRLQQEAVMTSTKFSIKPKLPINLIGIDDDIFFEKKRIDWIAEDIIGKYDFGVCMAAITPTGMWVDDRFFKDVKNETCTLYRSFGREFAVAHYERIRTKYPWPLILDAKANGLDEDMELKIGEDA